MRSAKGIGASPACGTSGMSAGQTSNTIPAFLRSSCRLGETEARMIGRGGTVSGFQDDIVDQPCVADKCGNGNESWVNNRLKWSEFVGIDDFEVVETNGG